jgi:NADH-quinone oxidoreductase subunit M
VNERLPDLSRRELVVLMPLVAGMLWMGVYPKPFLERAEVSLTELIETVERKSSPTLFPMSLNTQAVEEVAGGSAAAAMADAPPPTVTDDD